MTGRRWGGSGARRAGGPGSTTATAPWRRRDVPGKAPSVRPPVHRARAHRKWERQRKEKGKKKKRRKRRKERNIGASKPWHAAAGAATSGYVQGAGCPWPVPPPGGNSASRRPPLARVAQIWTKGVAIWSKVLQSGNMAEIKITSNRPDIKIMFAGVAGEHA